MIIATKSQSEMGGWYVDLVRTSPEETLVMGPLIESERIVDEVIELVNTAIKEANSNGV